MGRIVALSFSKKERMGRTWALHQPESPISRPCFLRLRKNKMHVSKDGIIKKGNIERKRQPPRTPIIRMLSYVSLSAPLEKVACVLVAQRLLNKSKDIPI